MNTMNIGYQKSDMDAAEKMVRLHLEKLKKHIDSNEWPLVCSDLRAIEGEVQHANRIAATLSFNARNNQPLPRISRGKL